MSIIAQIASLQDRENNLYRTLKSLSGQVDTIYVALNGYDKLPPYCEEFRNVNYRIMDNSLGDAAKILDFDKRDGFVFLCDDDLGYPDNYVSYMISKYNEYPGSIITLHGKVFNRPITSSHRGFRVNCHCLHSVEKDHIVEVGGSGVMLLNTKDIKLTLDMFPRKNMSDIWIARAAKEQGVKIIVAKHSVGFLKYMPPPTTIWRSHTKENDAYQVGVLKSFLK